MILDFDLCDTWIMGHRQDNFLRTQSKFPMDCLYDASHVVVGQISVEITIHYPYAKVILIEKVNFDLGQRDQIS